MSGKHIEVRNIGTLVLKEVRVATATFFAPAVSVINAVVKGVSDPDPYEMQHMPRADTSDNKAAKVAGDS